MSMVTDMWLVRHGSSLHHQTEQLQWDGVPLSEEGRAQAGRLAARLGQLADVVAIYSSPLPRAWDTAVPIAAALGLEPIPRPELGEIDFGQAGGLTMEQFRQRWPDLANPWEDADDLSFQWPGGESRGGFHRRIVPAMEALAQAHRGQRIIVVAHTGTLCCYLAHLFVGNPARWRDFAVRPASVTRVEVGDRSARFLLRDDISHLLTPA